MAQLPRRKSQFPTVTRKSELICSTPYTARTQRLPNSHSLPYSTSSISLDSAVWSPRSLYSREARLAAEEAVLKHLQTKADLSETVKSAVSSIKNLRTLAKPPGWQQGSRQFGLRTLKHVSMLELIETQWDAGAGDWSVEEWIAKCSVLSGTEHPVMTGPLPRSLIQFLRKSALGLEVLKSALKSMPEARLYSDANYAIISDVLKERKLQTSRSYKLLRRRRVQTFEEGRWG